MSVQLSHVRSVLCLGAHSDDIEIGCGGTVAQLARQHPGAEVHWVVLSAAGARAAEAREGPARFLPTDTARHVTVADFPDSYFPHAGREIKDFFHNLARRVCPDLVLTHRREDLHQDHRLVAELTWNTFRQQLILEYEIPKYDGDLSTPNVYVPLAESEAQQKVETIMSTFLSQRGKPWFTAETLWALLRIRGIECRSPSGFAEGFHCRKMCLAAALPPKQQAASGSVPSLVADDAG